MLKKGLVISLRICIVLAVALAFGIIYPTATVKAGATCDIYPDMDDTAGFQGASTVDVEKNGQFTLEVYVVAEEQQVAGVDVFLNFDKDKLEVKAITADNSSLAT